jgi:hypothetical protein
MRSIFTALILTLLTGVAQASPPVTFFDWFSGPTDDNASFSAITANDASEILGEFCFYSTQKCSWQISIDLRCKENEQHWVLANADSAYEPLTITCMGFNKANSKYNYSFNSWKDAEALFKNRQNNLVGFAMPIANTQFRVIRFSLKGVNDATGYLEHEFQKSLPPKKPTSDQTL